MRSFFGGLSKESGDKQFTEPDKEWLVNIKQLRRLARKKWKVISAEMSRKPAKLGLAAVLAYGIFDGITYTSFFVMAFLGYEKVTGKNPAANIQALIGIVLLMWTGNNVTRPFHVAGAAALAPLIDKGLRKIQTTLNLPSPVYLVVCWQELCNSCLSWKNPG
ncbi:hypothetical protein Droror1_Dr00017598 [Drosera rotundifolia]